MHYISIDAIYYLFYTLSLSENKIYNNRDCTKQYGWLVGWRVTQTDKISFSIIKERTETERGIWTSQQCFSSSPLHLKSKSRLRCLPFTVANFKWKQNTALFISKIGIAIQIPWIHSATPILEWKQHFPVSISNYC